MAPSKVHGRRADWRNLAKALIWRARIEGFAAIFIYPFGLIGFITLVGAVSLWDKGGHLPALPVGGPFGVRSSGVAMNLIVLAMPSLLTLGISIGAGRSVQSLIGSESSTGTFEMLMAQGFGPKDLARATLAVALAAIAVIWLAMSGVLAALVSLLDFSTGAHLHLTGAYLAMTVLLPPIIAAAGTCLATALGFAAPTLTQPAERGVAGGTGAVVGTIASLPGVATTVLMLTIAGRISALEQLGIGLVLAAVVGAGSLWVIRNRFGYEGMLRSS